jgi:hypothetical protein
MITWLPSMTYGALMASCSRCASRAASFGRASAVSMTAN